MPPGQLDVECFFIQQSAAPTGKVTIVGSGVDCTYVSGRRVCNNTRVNVTINGVTVSVLAMEFDSPSNLAQDLANAINTHTTLSQWVVAAASGNTVSVTARSEGVDFNYPWQTSCSYNRIYFSGCGYHAELSPVATLHPLAP
jgi:phage tail sheath gpL-like